MKKILQHTLMLLTAFFLFMSQAYAYDNKFESILTSDYIEWNNNTDYYFVNGSTTGISCPYLYGGDQLLHISVLQENTYGFLVICGNGVSDDSFGGNFILSGTTTSNKTFAKTGGNIEIRYTSPKVYIVNQHNSGKSINLTDGVTIGEVSSNTTSYKDTTLTKGEINVNWIDAYAIITPALTGPGTFRQTSSGFDYANIQGNTDGFIDIQVESNNGLDHYSVTIPYNKDFDLDLTVQGKDIYYQNGNGVETISFLDNPFAPGVEYEVTYQYIAGPLLDPSTPTIGSPLNTFTSTNIMYTIPQGYVEIPGPEHCPGNTTLGTLSVYNQSTGFYENQYICEFPDPNSGSTTVETTLSGSTIIVNNNYEPPVNTIENNIDITGTGTFSDIDFGTGGLDNILGDFSERFGNTFDNIEQNFSFSGVTEKVAITQGNIINRLDTNSNNACIMFNNDGSFKAYGDNDYSININLLQGNSMDNVLIFPQKLLNFFTNPINNLLALSSVIETFDNEQEICYLGTVTKIEYQSFFKTINQGVTIGNFEPITIGELTVVDYVVLVVFGIVLTFGVVTIFSRLY